MEILFAWLGIVFAILLSILILPLLIMLILWLLGCRAEIPNSQGETKIYRWFWRIR